MPTLQITLDNVDEDNRWVLGTHLDVVQLRDMAIKEARESGCETVEVKTTDGRVVFRSLHGRSVESPKRLERFLVPTTPEPRRECDNRLCREDAVNVVAWAEDDDGDNVGTQAELCEDHTRRAYAVCWNTGQSIASRRI